MSISDFRAAIRLTLRRPGASLFAIASLALGIAINVSLFTIATAVLLSPLGFERKDGTVTVSLHQENPRLDGRNSFSPANFIDLRTSQRSFASLAAIVTTDETLVGTGNPHRVVVAAATPSIFDVFAVAPSLGRRLLPGDAPPGIEQGTIEGRGRVALLSHRLWLQRFGASDSVLGTQITLDDRAYQVVGILPQSAVFPAGADIWVPLTFGPLAPIDRGGMNLAVVGATRPRMSLAAVQNDVNGIAKRLWKTAPFNQDMTFPVVPLKEALFGGYRTTLLALFGLSGLLLIMIGTNVGIVGVSRSVLREREMAIRMAMGAERQRIVSQLMAEALIVAFAANGLALAGAAALLRVFVALAPGELIQLRSIHMAPSTIAFSVVVTVGLSAFFGLAPAFQLARADVRASLGGAGVARNARPATRFALDVLLIGQTTLAVSLLGATALLCVSYYRTRHVPLGIDPRNVLTIELDLPARYANGDRTPEVISRIVEQLRTLPQVEAVATSLRLPVVDPGGGIWFSGGKTQGPTTGSGDWRPEATFQIVTQDYFSVFRVPVVHGRTFNESDRGSGPPVVIVSEYLAAKYFPNLDPIGQRIVLTPWPSIQREIVGVVADTRQGGATAAIEPAIYAPLMQLPASRINLLVRSESNVSTLSRLIEQRAWSIDAHLSFGTAASMDARLSDALKSTRLTTYLITLFGITGVILSALGIFGVTALSTSQRIPEIGVRIALGALPHHVIQTLVGRVLVLNAVGIVLGILIALGTSRWSTAVLYNTVLFEPGVITAIVVLPVFVAMLASVVPATQALSVDPARVLRSSQ
jgi:putative ABC transport system permease protein